MSITLTSLSGLTPVLSGAITYMGVWDANANSPALASGAGTKGAMYRVSVAGTTSIDGVATWSVGDEVVFNGTTWDKISGKGVVDLTNAQTVAGTKTFSSPIAGSVTGTAANVTGTVAIANGGTGSTTQNFVDLTTAQTVAGIKTFSSTIVGSVNGNAATVTTNANLTGPVTSTGNATAIADGAIAVTKVGGTATLVPYFDATTFMGTDATFSFSDVSKTLAVTNVAASTVAITGKNIVTNNASATVTCAAGFNAYLGTNATTVAHNLPAAAGLQDGTIVVIMSQAAVSVSATFASVGATFIGAPATLAALTPITFIYHAATTQWIIYG